MKTVQKSYYICETCGRTSQKQGAIEECQASHVRISDDCVVREIFTKGKQFPRLLEITYPDGTVGSYYNNDRAYR